MVCLVSLVLGDEGGLGSCAVSFCLHGNMNWGTGAGDPALYSKPEALNPKPRGDS